MTRVDLVYPKIPRNYSAEFGHCVAFEKYDGTNLHWVWNRELGWWAFGTRRSRYDLEDAGAMAFKTNHSGLSEAVDIFRRDFSAQLAAIFLDHRNYDSDDITVFTEFVGPNSFAGLHKSNDEKQLVLFDVETQNGIVNPEQFVSDFAALNIARVVYRGKLSGKFVNDVRNGVFDLNEGVVCKSGEGDKLKMVKIKTNEYEQRVKRAQEENWEANWQ